MATEPELTDQIGELIHRAGELQEAVKNGDRTSSEIREELATIKAELNSAKAERDEVEAKEANDALLKEMRELAAEVRKPSKANLIGTGHQPEPAATGGEFIRALTMARSRDYEEQREGKELLRQMGSEFRLAPSESKGVIGTNDDGTAKATTTSTVGAGYLVPNALVTDVIQTATAKNPYRGLLQVVTGVRALSIQVPTEGPAPARAQVVSEGSTKTNLGLTVNNYTATFYTLAQIFDLSNQLIRHSSGAAEQLVRSRLARGFALGEAYYILQGSGSSEPKGLLTSIGTSGTFVTSFTASGTTLAGSSASAIAKASGVLAQLARTPDAAVVNAGDFYVMLAQGTDNAGFFFAPAVGPTGIDVTRSRLSVWGIPVIPDINMPSDSMVVGEWSSAQLFIGDDFRIDTSSEANTRWDQNLTGFRGEEEIAFNGDPYVAAGQFQRITDFTP